MGRKVIQIPSIFEAAQTIEELEDGLSAQNPDFIKRMRTAHREHLAGKGKDWEIIKKELKLQ
jgi:hypothetical protein